MRLNLTMMVVVQVSSEAQFEYAWCLVRSKYPADIRKGIILLEDLFQVAFPRCDNILMLLSNVGARDEPHQIFFQNRDNSNKRDYLYYLAIGNTKLKVGRNVFVLVSTNLCYSCLVCRNMPQPWNTSEHFSKLNLETVKHRHVWFFFCLFPSQLPLCQGAGGLGVQAAREGRDGRHGSCWWSCPCTWRSIFLTLTFFRTPNEMNVMFKLQALLGWDLPLRGGKPWKSKKTTGPSAGDEPSVWMNINLIWVENTFRDR